MGAGDTMRHHGFTLIELLVTIAVIVIMATIAVPGFQNLISSNRLAADYNEILAGLNYARSEAVKRRKTVIATIDNDALDDGTGVWQLEVAQSGNVLKVLTARDGDIDVASAVIAFNALGRRESCTLDPCEITVESKRIEVNMAGMIGKAE